MKIPLHVVLPFLPSPSLLPPLSHRNLNLSVVDPTYCLQHFARYQINQTLTITVKIMIDFKSFLSHMTEKLTALFNIFAGTSRT